MTLWYAYPAFQHTTLESVLKLNLPEKSKCARADSPSVVKMLNGLLAYSATAQSTYEFYEVIDNWLGPWGDRGYPIGYGKKYNILFNNNEILNSADRPVSAQWVKGTTINLQLAVIQCVENRIKAGTLSTLDDRNLREFAFQSHPKAYLDAGLQAVAAMEITSLPIIAVIPWREFNPLSPTFGATFRQVYHVIKDPGILSWFMAFELGTTKWEKEAVCSMLGTASEFLHKVWDDANHRLDYFFR